MITARDDIWRSEEKVYEERKDMQGTQMGSDFPISTYMMQKAGRNGIPVNGTFELTSRCNFNCRMCYVHGQTDMDRLKEKELSARQWLNIAEEAREQGLLFLLLTGGEAMLREDFISLYERLAVMGFRLVINTNGSLFTREIEECFHRLPPARVNISLYGDSDETYRELCGVPAAGKVKETIHTLRRMGISVRTTMMLTPWNCRDMEAVCAYGKQEQTMVSMSSYLFPPSRLDSGSLGRNKGRFSAGEAGALLAKREQLLLEKDEFEKYARHQLEICRRLEETDGRGMKEGDGAEPDEDDGLGLPIRCQAGRGAFWITWDGKLRPCGLFTGPEEDVLSEGFTAAWAKIHAAACEIRLPRECRYCSKRELCHVCAAMCQSETGHFDVRPEYVCRMTEGQMEEYRRLLGEKGESVQDA